VASITSREKADLSRMYKKLHITEIVTSLEPNSHKGSFLWCVPERVIMLTKIEYDIQPKNRKNYPGV
jgi:hypothetical protein